MGIMKATVKFEIGGMRKQRTLEVSANEPNLIVRELAKACKEIRPYTFISTIKCGRTEYQWFGDARGAGVTA